VWPPPTKATEANHRMYHPQGNITNSVAGDNPDRYLPKRPQGSAHPPPVSERTGTPQQAPHPIECTPQPPRALHHPTQSTHVHAITRVGCLLLKEDLQTQHREGCVTATTTRQRPKGKVEKNSTSLPHRVEQKQRKSKARRRRVKRGGESDVTVSTILRRRTVDRGGCKSDEG